VPPVSARTLHVANGTSTTNLLAAANVPGRTSIWADPLHEGPVPSGVSDDELVVIRADYLSEPVEGVSQVLNRDDVREDLQRWRAAIDDITSYDELILWFEHDLFDQLNLIQILDRLSRASRAKAVSLICIGAFPGHPNFKGLGELTPAEIGSLVDTRQLVTNAQLDLGARAWTAFRSSDPREIQRFAESDPSALPFLRAALQRHLQEFPWTRDGLSRSERRLLELVEAGPIDADAAFPLMHRGEDAFYIADGSFWQVACDLARASLVSLEIRSPRPAGFPEATITIAPRGVDTLRGRADRVAESGIDRWLGGVHLAGSDRVWRWNAATGNIVM
jgi:hypothetical protein